MGSYWSDLTTRPMVVNPNRVPSNTVINGKVETASGRWISAPPPIIGKSNAAITGAIKKVDQWLVANSVEEAAHRKDSMNRSVFGQSSAGKLSPADRDCMNVYLFNEPTPSWKVNR